MRKIRDLGLMGLTAFAWILAALSGVNYLHAATLLVVNKYDNTLAFIDPVAGNAIGRVPVGDEPHVVTVSSDGKQAFVANWGKRDGGTISVIDVPTRKEIRRVAIGPGSSPHGLFFAEGKLYFTAHGYKVIGRYDPAGNQIDWLLGVGQSGTEMMVADRTLRNIFTANTDSDNVTALTRATNPPDWKITIIPVGKRPHTIDISPDGKEVWTPLEQGGIAIIDPATKKIIATLELPTEGSNRVRFTPDGKTVLVTDRDGGELVVIDARLRREIKRLKLGKRPTDFVITPDGSRAYVSVSGENHVSVIDLKTLEPMGNIATGTNPEGIAWTDGQD